MDNDALMRRIAAVKETQAAKSAQQPSHPPANARQPNNGAVEGVAVPRGMTVRSLPTGVAKPEGPSLIETIINRKMPYHGPDRRDDNPEHRSQFDGFDQRAVITPAAPEPDAAQQPAPGNAAPAMAPQPVTVQSPPMETPVPEVQDEKFSFQDPVPTSVRPANVAPTADSRPAVGVLTSCDGVNANVCSIPGPAAADLAVGQMLIIFVGSSRVIGLIFRLERTDETHGTAQDSLLIHMELQGEICQSADGTLSFSKGIARYPAIGSPVVTIDQTELSALYTASGTRNAVIGTLAQDEAIPAYINVENMLSKHFALLGSTGCGKSSAVSLLLRASQEVVPDLRTIILDPHNEYSSAFPEAKSLDNSDLDLPFWLFQLDEYAEVLFRGKPRIDDEIDALRELIPDAKQRFREGEERTSLRNDNLSNAITADTPVPYRMSDLFAAIEEELGLLESRFPRSVLKSLRARITAHCNDPRYRFMFRDKTIADRAEDKLNVFFHLPGDNRLMSIVQMSGMPAEVVNAVASVLCRLSFEMCIAAKGKLKVLILCEEAHRYVPKESSAGFEPTRRAIARIAKEGRKYGTYIGIVSQRAAELDPTILSQCSTVFSLRMTNDHDQMIMRKSIPNSSVSTISFLSSLSNREAIAFGEGIAIPMRLRFRTLPEEWLPGRDRDAFDPSNQIDATAARQYVFQQWREIAGVVVSRSPIQ